MANYLPVIAILRLESLLVALRITAPTIITVLLPLEKSVTIPLSKMLLEVSVLLVGNSQLKHNLMLCLKKTPILLLAPASPDSTTVGR